MLCKKKIPLASELLPLKKARTLLVHSTQVLPKAFFFFWVTLSYSTILAFRS